MRERGLKRITERAKETAPAAITTMPERPCGLFVVLVGPDGVGKTTLADAIARRCRPQFAEVRYFHWCPVLSEELAKTVPEGGKFITKPPQPTFVDRLLSPIRLMRHVLLFEMGYKIKVASALRRGALVIGDRYIYPYYYAPTSVKYLGPRWLVDVAMRFVPQPDLVFCLHGDPELACCRKAELSVGEIKRQMDLCLELAERQPHFVLIDISKSVDEILKEALSAIEGTRSRRER